MAERVSRVRSRSSSAQVRTTPLHAEHHDVHRGSDVTSRPLPSLVTSTSEPLSATREVDPGDAHVGAQEAVAQSASGEGVERVGLGRHPPSAGHPLEQRGSSGGRGGRPGR